MILCIIAPEVLAIFIDADARIKGIQIVGRKFKIANFADDTTIFLKVFSCLTYQNRINFKILRESFYLKH